MKKYAVMLMIVLFLTGCGAWVVKSTPDAQLVKNDQYEIQLIPTLSNGYSFTAFDLTIKNKTTADIELLWDKTYYLQNDQTSGGFIFEGILYADRNNPKQPDIIFPGKIFSKLIFPSILTTFDRGWYHQTIPDGQNGIYITLKVSGQEVREKLNVVTSSGRDEKTSLMHRLISNK